MKANLLFENSFSRSLPTGIRRPRVPCAVMAALFVSLLTGCADDANLQTGLTDADANEMVSVLMHVGISARKKNGKEGATLVVAADELSRATVAMRQAGLPRRNLSNLGTIFKKEGMISTPLEERVRYLHGIADELQDTLQQFDRVIAARVHIVLPERVVPGEPLQPSSAAVFVKFAAPIDQEMVALRVRNLVASSVPGLMSEEGRKKVAVVLEPSEVSHPMVEWRDVGPFRVQAASARALQGTLLALAASVALLLGGVVSALAIYYPPLVVLRKRYFDAPPSLMANDAVVDDGDDEQ